MIAAAVFVVARPLLRKQVESSHTRSSSVTVFVAIAIATPLLSTLLYFSQSNWKWNESAAIVDRQHDERAMLERLEAQAQRAPNDATLWLALGRASVEAGQLPKAVSAYEKAFELTKGANTEATLGLAEAMAQANPESLGGRAGELFELALERDPSSAKALWFGAIVALSKGKLPVARERLQRVLAQNPPENISAIIERQLQDIDQQLGEQKAVATGRRLTVDVSLSVEVAKEGVDKSTPLFVLARDPVNAGPPLAVMRKTVADLPLKVTLTDRDAMLPGRGISSVPRVQVVARISKSGAPQAQPGDLFGDAIVDFSGSNEKTVAISIGRKVEK